VRYHASLCRNPLLPPLLRRQRFNFLTSHSATMQLTSKSCLSTKETQLIIQTDPISLASLYLPFFGTRFSNFSNIFQNTFLPFHHARKLDNFSNLITITINGALYFQDVPPLIRLLKDQTCDGVPCPRLSRITIYAKDLCSRRSNLEAYPGSS
jgi:hypothetical protein